MGKNGQGTLIFSLIIIVLILVVIIIFGAFRGSFTGGVVKEPDSDNDGLSDIEEERIGTDPLNPNTDGDRYLDGEDKEPLKTNSANIQIYLLDKDWSWNSAITNVISIALKFGSISSETVIADAKADLLIENQGDDYSEYVNFDIIFEVSNTEVVSVKDSLGKLEIGEKVTRTYHKQILLKEVPDLLWNLIKEGDATWDIKIDNLNYRKF